MKHKKQPLAFTPHKKRLLSAVIGSICAAMATQPVQASTLSQYWKGAGTDANIDTLANWETLVMPVSGTDASLSFDSYVVGTGSLTVNNNLIQTPIYNTLKFFNGGFNLTGNQIALRPSATNSTIINNVAGSNTITAPLRIDTNTANSVTLDNAQIAVVNGSLSLGGAVSASQVNLSTLLGANASLSMNGVSAKSFNATGGTHNLTGVLDSASINFQSTNFIVGGAGGSIHGAVSVGSGSQLTLDNTAAVASNRLNGSAVMNAGSTLLLKGNATTDVAENVVLGSDGSSYSDNALRTFKVEGSGANVLLTLTRPFNTLGLYNYASNGVLGDQERIKFSNPPITHLDGLMVRSIVNGQELAIYDTSKGVIAATTTTSLSGATATDNVYINSSQSLTGNLAINSLAVNNATITEGGANSISLASGKLLTSGTVNIAPTIDFGTAYSEIINLGTTTLAGGINGSNYLSVRGTGQLELQNTGGFSGNLLNYSSLLLSADNVLAGTGVNNFSVLAIGSTTQNLSGLYSIGNVTGTGSIVAANDINLSQDLVNVSLGGKNVSIGANTINGNINASQSIYLGSANYIGNGLMNGIISGTAGVSGNETFTNQNTYTGNSSGNLVLTGNGSIAASSAFLNGNLTIRAADGDNGSLDRIGNTASVSLTGFNNGVNTVPSVLSLQGSGSVNLFEDIGVLNAGVGARLEMTNGTGSTSLRADALNLLYDGSLTLSLGNASSFYVDIAPNTYTGTNVVKDVYVEKSIGGKFQSSWAAYDSNNGQVYEAVVAEKALSSAGSDEFVRVTDATNQALNADHTVGAVNVDTNQDISGNGTLTRL